MKSEILTLIERLLDAKNIQVTITRDVRESPHSTDGATLWESGRYVYIWIKAEEPR